MKKHCKIQAEFLEQGHVYENNHLDMENFDCTEGQVIKVDPVITHASGKAYPLI